MPAWRSSWRPWPTTSRWNLGTDDHALSGEWGDHRDCHVKPDLVLIYQKSGADTLRLVRLGSHAELGL